VSGPILTLAECHEGRLARASLEALGAARRIADRSGSAVVAVLIGDDVRQLGAELGAQGADRVFSYEGPELSSYATEVWTRAVAAVVAEVEPTAVLLAGTALGLDLAPRLAARLGLGLVSECVRLDVSEDGTLCGERAVFGGRVLERVSWRAAPALATLRIGLQALPVREPSRSVDVLRRSVATDARARVVGRLGAALEDGAGPELSEARIVVAAGRGIGSAENLAVLRDLAEALGAALAGSRAVVDAGWLDHQRQVGQTGRTIAPDLYVACGISGAIQHLAGMSSSGTVVAINRDSQAPIFAAADYGIVGDVLEIARRLAAAVRERKL
jgi:electron transfer flavoprotein alpha subunit